MRADKQLVSGLTTEQRYAKQLVELIAQNANNPITVTGHSLGGYLAVVGSMGVDNVKGVFTYNAPGIDATIINSFSSREVAAMEKKTINMWHSADPIHLCNESFTGGNSDYSGDRHIGRNVELSGYDGIGDRLSQLFTINPFREHSINLLNDRMKNNMGGCL